MTIRAKMAAGAVTVVAVVAAGVVWAAVGTGGRSGPRAALVAAPSSPPSATVAPSPPLTVVSVSPADGTTGVAGSGAIHIDFSTAISARSPLPVLTPKVAGQWVRNGASLSFVGALLPRSQVAVTVPGGAGGMVGANGVRLATAVVDRFEVGDGSVLRLQQLLSLLGYSPLAWTPSGPAIPPADAAAQAAAAFTPPPGAFTWRQAGWPAELISRWAPGVNGTLTKGLVMAFEADHGLSPDGVAGSQVWAAVLQAVAAHQLSTGGYTYAVASKAQPETLTIWHDGQQVLHSPANTGISQAPTVDGTFPVYERLRSQVMKGTNPDGSSYADPVQYVAYFNGGDAVHYIPRSSFGYPQSLGCVELPLSVAAQAWPYLAVGSLVTASG